MILTELIHNGTLIRHYSDQGMLLLQNETGAKYSDPIDVVPCQYTYTETNEPIEGGETGELSAEEALNIILGGDV